MASGALHQRFEFHFTRVALGFKGLLKGLLKGLT